jgi:hypothetical protein
VIQVFSIADIPVNMVVSTRQILACAHFTTVAFLVIISEPGTTSHQEPTCRESLGDCRWTAACRFEMSSGGLRACGPTLQRQQTADDLQTIQEPMLELLGQYVLAPQEV